MKRRQVEPRTVVSLRNVALLRGIGVDAGGALRIGAAETLRAVERAAGVARHAPALTQAVLSISTPILRNMGTLGGNLCLDTRCYYVNQNFEWRRAINHCLKCGGDTCWTAPGSTRCWAVNSSDAVPVMIALGAKYRLLGPDGVREVAAEDLYDVTDGREWLRRRPDELMTDIVLPDQAGARSVYLKLRRRDTFDFPVLGVAARIALDGDRVESADVVLNAVGPAPVRCREAEGLLRGARLSDETIAAAAEAARKAAKPLDNTDYMPSWRKRMVPVFVRRALGSLRPNSASGTN
jgi:4-hydroxybenzoyl-CoA reductase subunit beta